MHNDMKAIALTEYAKVSEHIPGKVEMLQCEKPTPGPEDVLIRIAYASICGSDAHVVRCNLTPELEAAIRSMLPFHMGHEISGVIEDLGDKAKEMGLKVGDRITANYTHFCNSCYFCRTGQENFCEHPETHFDGMAEYVCWHMSQVYKIPDNVSLLHASQTEPLSIALNARKAGASLIVVSDIVEAKYAVSLKCGADACVNPLEPDWQEKAMALTGGLGFDAVIECSGASSAAQSMPDLMTKNGHCVMFAMYKPDFELKINPYRTLYEQSKHIHGMYTSADSFPATVAMLSSIDSDDIIEGVFPPEQCQEAFDKALSGKYIKLVFRFSDDV